MPKSRKYDGTDTRRVLGGMVMDATVCSRIATQWEDGGLFPESWSNMIAGWVLRYFEKHGVPPKRNIEALFEQWASKTTSDEKTINEVEKFLEFVNDEFTEQDELPSSDYILDLAGTVFNKTRIRNLTESLTDDLDYNKIPEAQGKIAKHLNVELGIGAVVKPAEDYSIWVSAFDTERQRPLITYPGGLGRFFGDRLGRGKFIAFQGMDKSGKSFWMLDLAYMGVRQKRKVAYFEAGDSDQDEVIQRIGARAARKPDKPGVYNVPVRVNNKGKVKHEERDYKTALSSGEGYKAFRKISRGKDRFRLSCYSNSSINVAGIESVLHGWEREGWLADILVIDYADILAPPKGTRETNDQIDETWKHLRRLSQDFKCLLLTATQSSALAYKNENRLMSKKHFSGRKTKLAHVDGMIGINKFEGDKEKGICRLNWIVARKGYFNESRAVVVAGCLDIGCIAIKSAF